MESLRRRLRQQLRALRTSERGMALPVAMFAMIASMGLAGAAVVSSVNVQQGSKRDSGSKSAIAAADAGANVATMRLARYSRALTTNQCITESNGTLVASPPTTIDGEMWCPPVEGTVGRGTYRYWVSPAGGDCDAFDLCIVSEGTVDGVTRRIEMNFKESTLDDGTEGDGGDEDPGGTGGGSFEGLIGQDSIEITGNADIEVGIGTNGEVQGQGASHSVCGDIRVGIGKKAPDGVNQCAGYDVTNGNVDLPPVSSFMPADIATNNANARFTTCSGGLPVGCQSDSFTKGWGQGTPFNPDTRTLKLEGQGSLTVSGPDYWLCKLEMAGQSELIMRAGTRVRFFFDTPQNCGMPAGAQQVKMTGGSTIKATGYQAGSGNFDMPGFFLLGSGAVDVGGNQGTNELIVYGPESAIELHGTADFKGVLAGKTLKIVGSGTVLYDDGYELPPELKPPPKGSEGDPSEQIVTARLFTPQTYVECTGAASPVDPPNAHC